MNQWFDDGDFADVADLLLEPSPRLQGLEKEWDACIRARHRASISRAYYAAFIRLKARLCAGRDEKGFPRVDAHRKLREAVERVLGQGHRLAGRLASLLRLRKIADYELSRTVSQDDALAALDAAFDAIEMIDSLEEKHVERMASELGLHAAATMIASRPVVGRRHAIS